MTDNVSCDHREPELLADSLTSKLRMGKLVNQKSRSCRLILAHLALSAVSMPINILKYITAMRSVKLLSLLLNQNRSMRVHLSQSTLKHVLT